MRKGVNRQRCKNLKIINIFYFVSMKDLTGVCGGNYILFSMLNHMNKNKYTMINIITDQNTSSHVVILLLL